MRVTKHLLKLRTYALKFIPRKHISSHGKSFNLILSTPSGGISKWGYLRYPQKYPHDMLASTKSCWTSQDGVYAKDVDK